MASPAIAPVLRRSSEAMTAVPAQAQHKRKQPARTQTTPASALALTSTLAARATAAAASTSTAKSALSGESPSLQALASRSAGPRFGTRTHQRAWASRPADVGSRHPDSTVGPIQKHLDPFRFFCTGSWPAGKTWTRCWCARPVWLTCTRQNFAVCGRESGWSGREAEVPGGSLGTCCRHSLRLAPTRMPHAPWWHSESGGVVCQSGLGQQAVPPRCFG